MTKNRSLIILHIILLFFSEYLSAQTCSGTLIDGWCFLSLSTIGDRNLNDATAECRAKHGIKSTLPYVFNKKSQDFMRSVMIQNQLNFTWLGFQFREDQPVAENTARRPNYWKWIDDSILEHQGCFDDWAQSPSRMDMEIEVTNLLSKITIEDCKTRCQRENNNKPVFERYVVAGLQDGNKCFCSKYFGKFGPIDSCTVPCKDNSNEKCGGYGRNSIIHLSGSYSPWYYKQPNSHRGSPQACAVSSNYHQMKLGDENCENLNDYLCELPLSFCNGNNNNYYVRNGTCIFVGTSKNWFDSRNDCIEKGGDLLIYKTDLTRVTMLNMVSPNDLNLNNDAKFWMGLTKWRWRIHGRNDGPEMKYSNFHSSVWGNDPQSTNLEQCLIMSADHNYQWIWVPCTKLSINDKEYPFLCIIDVPITTEAPTTPLPTSTPIPLTPGTDPNLGASTSESSELTKFQIALIIVLIIIIIVIILAIIFCVYYRYKNKEGAVQPEDPKFDARPDAPVPQQDMYIDRKARDRANLLDNPAIYAPVTEGTMPPKSSAARYDDERYSIKDE